MANVSEEFYDTDLTDGENVVEEVNHTGYDGFIPFTNGGFDLLMPTTLYNIWSSGNFPEYEPTRKLLDDVIDTSLKDSLTEFCEKNSEKLLKLYTPEQVKKADNADINYHDLYDKVEGGLAEELSEFETEWLSQGGTFWYQFRVLYFNKDNRHNETGEAEACFMAGVNTDFEYGRDKGFDISYEETIKLSELTVEKIDIIIKKMVNSI